MQRKFQEILRQPFFFYQPGIMEYWNGKSKQGSFITLIIINIISRNFKYASAPGIYLPEGHHPIIPFFQHSIIPISCERSEPKFIV
jgi:hypothetical protein